MCRSQNCLHLHFGPRGREGEGGPFSHFIIIFLFIRLLLYNEVAPAKGYFNRQDMENCIAQLWLLFLYFINRLCQTTVQKHCLISNSDHIQILLEYFEMSTVFGNMHCVYWVAWWWVGGDWWVVMGGGGG